MDIPNTRRESEVWQACDDLWNHEGDLSKITGDALRDHLVILGYKKGSPNEIYKFRRSWKIARGISELDLGEHEQKSLISDPVIRAVSLVYEQIQTEARDQLVQVQQSYEEKLSKINDSYNLLFSQSEAQIKQIEDQAEQISAMREQIMELEEQLFSEKNNNALLLERCETSGALFVQYKDDWDQLQIKLKEQFDKQVTWCDKQVSNSKLEKDAAIASIAKTHQDQWHKFSDQANLFQVQLRQLQDKNELYIKNHSQVLTQNLQLKNELTILNKELLKKQTESKQLSKKCSSLEVKYAGVRVELNSALKKVAEQKQLWHKIERDLNALKQNTSQSVAS